jgi:hypothetical protein
MDQVKYAFQKVKQDMDLIEERLSNLTSSFYNTESKLSNLEDSYKELLSKLDTLIALTLKEDPTQNLENPMIQQIIPTEDDPFRALKPQNITFSTGNWGVPTNKQTNQQTNQHTIPTHNAPAFDQAATILDSLDKVKKEIRSKFKKITDQEFLVFSLIYQFSEQEGYTDYKSLSQKLNLTESSIRDYVGRLIKKEIPIEKIKVNNKLIQLKVSDNLKKIAPLSIILQLREI